MKIVIYGIAKNESKFVKRFMEACKDADMVVVGVDTSTTDNTKELLQQHGASVIDISVNPWRFDTARNLVLDSLPLDCDLCISVDLDEVFLPGWRQKIEEIWNPNITRIKYKFIYNWLDDEQTIPGLIQIGFKIHARNNYKWVLPIHEYLESITGIDNETYCEDIVMHHYPDIKKDRSYAEIIDSALEEDPNSEWMRYLKIRQLFISKKYDEVIEKGKEFINTTQAYKNDGLSEMRAEVMRLIARCLSVLEKGEHGEIQLWMMRNVAECPNQREAWVYMAEAWMMYGNFALAYSAAMTALSIKTKGNFQEFEERCWDDNYLASLAKKAYKQMNKYQRI